MESLVVSLETAKQLKAAGFPQDSITFAWNGEDEIGVREDYKKKWWPTLTAAPTAQELADQLPQHLDESKYRNDVHPLSIFKREDRWLVAYPTVIDGIYAPTMAEALAKLYILLHNQKQ